MAIRPADWPRPSSVPARDLRPRPAFRALLGRGAQVVTAGAAGRRLFPPRVASGGVVPAALRKRLHPAFALHLADAARAAVPHAIPRVVRVIRVPAVPQDPSEAALPTIRTALPPLDQHVRDDRADPRDGQDPPPTRPDPTQTPRRSDFPDEERHGTQEYDH